MTKDNQKMAQKEKQSSLFDQDTLKLDYFIPYCFNKVTNKTNLTMADYLASLNFTVPQWRVLAILKGFGELSIGEITEHAVVRQSTLSRVVDQLERQGLVKRKPLAKNKRIVLVKLTKQGDKMFDKIYPAALSLHNLMVDALTKKDQEALYSIFDKLSNRLDHVRNSWANIDSLD